MPGRGEVSFFIGFFIVPKKDIPSSWRIISTLFFMGRVQVKKVEAILRPAKFDQVKEALELIGIRGMTVSQIVGCGTQKGHVSVYRGQEYSINLLDKIKIEIVVEDKFVDQVINRISSTAKTGEIGDGKIFVYPVEKAVRIRTGESGEDAI